MPPPLAALGEGSHGSILNGNYAPNRLSSAWKPTASGKLTFDQPVVTQRLNEAGWGETILFACERMSRADEEAIRIVGEVVELLLKIDPQFAARVIKRSGPKVWSAVGQSIVEFGQTWHASGNVKRARAFMIASGRPEFAEIVWPLVSSLKSQEQMETMRLVPRFNPAVLGDQLSCHYSSLAEHTRDTLAAEMAYHGDSEGSRCGPCSRFGRDQSIGSSADF
ncbi:hypothetical protein ACOJBO_05360 [Rhizobium beringeri]